jgi:hypothetical protein
MNDYAPVLGLGIDVNPRESVTVVTVDGETFLHFEVKDHVIYLTKDPFIDNLPYIKTKEGNTGIAVRGGWNTLPPCSKRPYSLTEGGSSDGTSN